MSSSPTISASAVVELLGVARDLVLPFAAFDDAFLRRVAQSGDSGFELIGGVALTAATAALALRARAALDRVPPD